MRFSTTEEIQTNYKKLKEAKFASFFLWLQTSLFVTSGDCIWFQTQCFGILQILFQIASL